MPHMAPAYSRGKKFPHPGVHPDVRTAIAALAALTLLAAPAHAADHLMTVDEVATSLGASTANQFVELLDPADEPFLLGAPYRLAVYDGAGVGVGSQSLGSGMAIVDGGTPMLVGRGAIGAPPDVALTVALPTSAGQACFERGNGDRIHCLRWGTIANPVGSIAAGGPAPGDGQSLQICSGTAALGAPTPRASNSCGAGGGGGPGTAPADRAPPRVSAVIPRQTLAAVRNRGLRVRVRSNEAGRARAWLRRRGRTLRTYSAALRANVTRTVTLRLAPAARRALIGVRATRLVVRLRVVDAAGNARNLTRSAVVRR